ncbi:MAG: Type 1 glutamine amidotransferase-like domain-containing protein [Acidobacteriota bacterium]
MPIQPILLLADSQLLFWSNEDGLFLERVRELLEGETPKAAYLGASNGDLPEFYDLFVAAMESIRISDCRMIPSEPSDEDLEYVEQADVILLAGGDTARGWQTFEKNGIKQKVIERYYTGALLIGISAGAVQLGLNGIRETPERTNGSEDGSDESRLFETFKLIPLVIDAHQEPDWERLVQVLPEAGELIQGLGIPSGGGAFVHPDMTVEPIRRPLVELSLKDDSVRQSLIFPPDPDQSEEDPSAEAAASTAPKASEDDEDEPKALQPIIIQDPYDP